MIKKAFAVALFLFPVFSSFGQNLKAIDRELQDDFIMLQTYNLYHTSTPAKYPNDSIVRIDSLCIKKLRHYGAKVPATISYEFKMLHVADVNIMTSDDSLFRMYVWNSFISRKGGWAMYDMVFQYNPGDSVRACTMPHPDQKTSTTAFYNAVYTIKGDEKTFYLATYENKDTGKKREEGIKLFTIEKGKLNDTVKGIKTATGFHNEVNYIYDIGTKEDPSPDNGISYDTATATVEIPVVLEGGKMTERHIKYHFNGKYFEKVEKKEEKN